MPIEVTVDPRARRLRIRLARFRGRASEIEAARLDLRAAAALVDFAVWTATIDETGGPPGVADDGAVGALVSDLLGTGAARVARIGSERTSSAEPDGRVGRFPDHAAALRWLGEVQPKEPGGP